MTTLDAVRWISLPSHQDTRGVLTSIEAMQDIPIDIKRIFYMHHVVADRGGHAHTDTDQVLIGMAGQFQVDLSDGQTSQTYLFNDPTRGLYVPRLIFTNLYNFSPGAVCLVLANTHYDMSKSIRSWEDYLRAIHHD